MQKPKKSICVYCASNNHIPGEYIDAAVLLGKLLCLNGYRLVYGGGNNGLMGILSSVVHENGGYVTGVITKQFIDMGFAYEKADEMIVSDTMRERKARMEQMSDAFIALPGGYGTLEELLEIITLKQLEQHEKPVVILNTGSYFKGLIDQFEKAYQDNVVAETYRDLYHISLTIEDAVSFISKKI